jgi:hypothetical protein
LVGPKAFRSSSRSLRLPAWQQQPEGPCLLDLEASHAPRCSLWPVSSVASMMLS